ncbi:TnsA-like heteromeric transposase endonuclease subunit [Streptomyces sp. R-74717]|uniref:TnsA-like heteromeric transposase endonuclease subunit n=1 Tax=Streptomyces TaxID=1883 RepID=UPI0037B2C1B0
MSAPARRRPRRGCGNSASGRPRSAAAFAAMRRACEQLEWVYRLVGEIEAVRVANLRWLAGYRHARYGEAEGLNAAVTASFAVPGPLFTQAASVGDPLRVLPVVFHLLWCGRLAADLSYPLSDRTLVSRSEER